MSQERQFKSDVYKKWFKTRDRQGFLSVKDALEINKFVLDIGEQKPGQEMSSSHTFIDADELPVILDKLYTGALVKGDAIMLYGGGRIDGNPISRVFKVEQWSDQNDAWAFKNGIFQAKETNTGAFTPIMDKPISMNLIKVNLDDVAKMRLRVNMVLQRFAVRFKDVESWKNDTEFLKVLNGELRDRR